MSEEHGPRLFEKEKAALDEAYTEHIKRLFEILATAPDDKDALARFKIGLERVRRTHVLAISVFSDHDKI